MVGTIAIAIAKGQPFENRTIRNQTFKKVCIFSVMASGGLYSSIYITICSPN